MYFGASAELDSDVLQGFFEVNKVAMPWLKDQLSSGNLGASTIKVRYVPIIMGAEGMEAYPARSAVRKKELAFDCSPQLNHQVFLNGTFNERLEEYLCGLNEAVKGIEKLGASTQLTAEFRDVLKRCLIQLSE